MIKWSEPEKGNDDSCYDHVFANIPFLGKVLIEWKSWNPYDTYDVYIPSDTTNSFENDFEYSYCTLEEAKNGVEEFYVSGLKKAAELVEYNLVKKENK